MNLELIKYFLDKLLKIFSSKKILLLLIFIVFFERGFFLLDPDFGYRLRTGKMILEQGVPKTDPYSYTMPSFPWVDHAWISDVFIYVIYSNFGKIGIVSFFAVLAILALLISEKISSVKNKEFLKPPMFLIAASVLLSFFGIRAQVITWLMTSIFLSVIFNKDLWRRFRFFLPLFFLAWANIHGGFFAGITILYIVFIVRFWTEDRPDFSDLIVVIASTFATFVNPYGKELYREVWSSVSDNSLRLEIVEWMPSFLSFDLARIFMIVLSAVFFASNRKKISLEMKAVFLFLLFEAIVSVRNVPIWLLVAYPLTIKTIGLFYDQVKSVKISRIRFEKIFDYFRTILVVIFFIQVWFSYKESINMSEKKFYPVGAIDFLRADLPKDEIFSDYGWGGYLIWKLPEKRVFIDGRMPSWRWNANIESESNNAFSDYLGINRGKKDYKEIFSKYNVSYVLVSKPRPKTVSQVLEEKFMNKLENLDKLFGFEGRNYNFQEKLKEEGWKVIYEDNSSVIYKRPENT